MTVDQLTFPAAVRSTDPDTSHDAAKAMKPEALRHRLLRAYGSRRASYNEGLTDDQAGHYANVRNGWWKRCAELRRAGLIEDTGLRRPGESGKNQMVCRITPKGAEVLRG